VRLPVRRRVAGGRARRSTGRRLRGRHPLVTAARLLGAATVALAAGAWIFVTDPGRFQLDDGSVEIRGLVHTEAADVRQAMGLAGHARQNVFGLRTADMQRRLLELPAVAAADVSVVLPDSLVVVVEEREPVLVWRVRDEQFLVDAAGVLIDEAPPGATGLPVVEDRRLSGTDISPAAGDILEPIDLQAVLRLAAVTPGLIGSSAEGLQLSVDSEEGYVVTAVPESWRAVFGHYTPTLRPPELIDQQVQCLRSLLAQDEPNIEVVYLATAEDRCGTFRPRPTPRHGPSPTDGMSPGEDPTPSPET
jgi:hypothetical protein